MSVFSLLRNQYSQVAHTFAEESLPAGPPGRSKNAAVALLEQQCEPDEIDSVLREIVDRENGDESRRVLRPWVFQHGRQLLGLLGLTESEQERTHAEGQSLAIVLSLVANHDFFPSLEDATVAEQTGLASQLATLKKPTQRRAALVQALMSMSDEWLDDLGRGRDPVLMPPSAACLRRSSGTAWRERC